MGTASTYHISERATVRTLPGVTTLRRSYAIVLGDVPSNRAERRAAERTIARLGRDNSPSRYKQTRKR